MNLKHHWLARYLLALGAVTAALLVWQGIARLTSGELPTYITFYPAVMLVALFVGKRPGMLATVAASLLADYWLIAPQGQFGIASFSDTAGLALFTGMGIFMSFVAGLYRQTRDHLENLVASRTTDLAQVNEQLQREIREHRQTETALRRAKEDWEETFNTIPDGVILLDDQHRILRANQAMAAQLGVTSEQCVGRKCHEAVHGLSQPPDFCPHTLTCHDGQEHIAEVNEPRLGGDFLVSTTPHCDPRGKVIGSVHVARNITERKQAEQALRESEERARQAMEAGRMFAFEWNPGTDEVIRSANCEPILGLSQDGTRDTGKDYFQRVHSDDRERFVRTATQLNPTHDRYTIEYRVRRPNGETATLYESARGLFDANGHLTRLFGMTADVTERKQAEQAIEAARTEALNEKKRLEALMQALPVGVAMVDARGGIIRSNKTYEELWGSPRPAAQKVSDYVAYQAWWADTEQPLQPEEWASARAVRKGETVIGQLLQIQRFDGSRAFVHNSAAPILDADGRIVGSAVAIMNITAFRLAEQALRESQADLNHAQAVAHIGSWRLKVLQNELLWSDETYRIFRIPPGTPLTYETFLARTHPEDRAYVDQKWQAALRGEPYDLEHRILAGDTLKWVRERAELEFTADGTLLGGFGIIQDITQRKQAEQALRQSEEALRQANELLEGKVRERTTELAGTVRQLQAEIQQRRRAEEQLQTAHDQLQLRASQLRALAGELTLTEQRERRRIAKLLHDHLQQLLAGAKYHLAPLGRHSAKVVKETVAEVDQLLKESINVSRSLTVELSPPILQEGSLSASLQWLTRWMEDKHGLKVEFTADHEMPPLGEDVKILLFESVRELLFNVVKHARVSTASVELRQANHQRIHITVRDNGSGFDPSQVPQVLAGGGGFGLFSIRERLDLIGGKLEIDSVIGQGSCFRMMAPVSQTAA